MAAHATHHTEPLDERVRLGDRAWPLYRAAWAIAIVGLLASVGIGYFADEDHSFKRFFHAYLASYGFFLSIGLGSLFFVLIQHLTKAGWSVNVRRVAECLGSTMPVICVLGAPLIVAVLLNNGVLYPWARPLTNETKAVYTMAHDRAVVKENPAPDASPVAHENMERKSAHEIESQEEIDKDILTKRKYLNNTFFLIRLAVYFLIWSFTGVWYYRQSTAQDHDGDTRHTVKMQTLSPILSILTMLSLTFGAFDLLMSLDPLWYSTMFGVYYFAGCAVVIFAVMVVLLNLLQANGYLRKSVTADHYHDLGKLLFGFVFFYGYVAFSQYMLLWYSNIPEETAWFQRHGATTATKDITMWSAVILVILFFNILIPFAGLLSRHVKRNRGSLIFWSVWLIVFHFVDMFWIVMPQLGDKFNTITVVMTLTSTLGIGGFIAAAFVKALAANDLRPPRDPRVEESLAFVNF